MEKNPSRVGDKKNRSSGVVRTLLCAIGLLLLPGCRAIQAQTTPADQPLATPTLHVYTNLKQVPVLVLTSDYKRMKPLDTSKFRLSIDSGPLFRPTYVRQEGEDPISLAILIDATNPESDTLPQLSQAIAALVPDYLQPQDHVSIYAIDCSLIRTAYDVPANATVLQQAVDRALAPWQIRQKQKTPPPPCKPTLPLWDSMNNVMNELTRQSGRRVLLAITDGVDEGSKTLWAQVMHRAQLESTAVFGLLPIPVIGTERRQENGAFIKVTSPFRQSPEDRFNQVCDLSGGVEVQARYSIVSLRLREFTKILRERYILEFPRASNEEPGVHTLEVSYRNKNNLYIVSSGISVPVASDDEKSGANTIPSNPSQKPVEGSRKVLLPNQ